MTQTSLRAAFALALFGLAGVAYAATQFDSPSVAIRELADVATSSAADHDTTPAPSESSPPARLLFQLRPRYAFTQQDNRPNNANALNMRTLLGYRTPRVGDWQLTGQMVNVSWIDEAHANRPPGDQRSPYPLTGDPEKTGVNLLFAEYRGLAGTSVRVGRQAIRLDNERFVGDADIRQMPQVYDAISIHNTSLQDTTFYAARLWRVRTYFGNTRTSHTTLLNARRDFELWPSLGAYAYFTGQPQLENDTGFRDNSHRILGARLEGNYRLADGLSLYYTGEAAQQRPFDQGDSRIRANYSRLAAGPIWGPYSLQIGRERLSSNNGQYAFQMPLSYNTFQGWAYAFFTTPAQGVRDVSISGSASYGQLNLSLKHHRFDTDFLSQRIGYELDFAAAYRIRESLTVKAVVASFRADQRFGRPSIERYSVTLQYDY